MTRFSRTLLLPLLFFSPLLAKAQETTRVTGCITDGTNGRPVEFASVRLLRPDSSFVKGQYSSTNGTFSLPLEKEGVYLLQISYSGYGTTMRKVTIPSSRKSAVYEMGRIVIMPSATGLGMVTIMGKAPEVEQIEDTLAFNASAYTVPEGSVLEELVKELPGVELEDNGTLTVNGRKVTRLLVNGNDFFKGNQKRAMKNIPADFVKKIKTYEKKSEYAEQTGIDDGEEETVMDIELKKTLNESWNANADLGYGTDHLYKSRLFLNRMTDFSRISAYGDLSNPEGTKRNEEGGVDFSYSNRRNRREMREADSYSLSGHLDMERNRNNQLTGNSSETFLTSQAGSSFSNRISHRTDRDNNTSGRFRLEWHPDTLSTLTFSPSFATGKNRNASTSRSATFRADPYSIVQQHADPLDAVFDDPLPDELKLITVNRNDSRASSHGKNTSIGGNLLWTRRLGKPGRNVSMQASAHYSTRSRNAFNRSVVDYLQPTATHPQRVTDRYSLSPSNNWSYTVQAGYSEPFGKYLTMQVRYRYEFRTNDNDLSRYDLSIFTDNETGKPLDWGTLPPPDALEKALDARNSRYATYKSSNHEANLSILYNQKKMHFNVGATLRPGHTEMSYRKNELDTVVVRKLSKVAPFLRFRYRFSKTHNLELSYRGSSTDPAMTALLDVTDDSNPLHITTGNPGLKPSWTNKLKMTYQIYFKESQTSIHLNGNYQQTSNTISNAVTYDEATGVRTTRPENINGFWKTNATLTLNTPLDAERRLRLSSTSSADFDHSVGFVRVSNFLDSQKNKNRTLNLRQRLRLRFRCNSSFEASVNGQFGYRHSKNKLKPSTNLNTYHFSYGARMQIRLPWNMRIHTDFNIRSRRGYNSPSMNTNEMIWNAQLSQSFLKKKAATISLQVFDILGKRSNLQRSINAQRRNDSWNETVYSYAMLHLIYRFNSLK